ncbi:MAG: beta-galactosidase, partial [Bacteroidaceae bacterium]
TRTGWPKLSTPAQFGEIIPLYGDYADGFWDRKLTEMPGDYGKSYIFRPFRGSTVIATEQLPKHSGKDEESDLAYPYFTCELGGGMMTSYHRRIKIDPMDVYSMALVRVGSGSNLPGYYMYHGGTNPEGEFTTLNERQTSNYTFHNDLPIKSYDFQAPLGEFGQVNLHYHLLRRLHLFLKDFGSELTSMNPTFPDDAPTNFKSDSTLRWCVRSNGRKGYVFVNNYHRLKTLTPKKRIQFNIDLQDGILKFPSSPITIPSNSSFFWPFNMSLNGLNLLYATAQPIAKLNRDNVLTVAFVACNGIPAEFAFDEDNLTVEYSTAKVHKKGKRILFTNLKPTTEAVIRLRDKDNHKVRIVLLSEKNSLSFWKEKLAGEERFFLSSSELTCDGTSLQLDVKNKEKASVLIYPALKSLRFGNLFLKGISSNLFTRYEIKRPMQKTFKLVLQSVQEAGIAREVSLGKAKVAMQPEDSDFSRAAVWHIQFPKNMNPDRDVYLSFSYVGDVARLYLDGKLLTDNFYNGNAFEIGLKRFAPDIYTKELILKILPLRKDIPVYLPLSARPDFKGMQSVISIPKVNVYEKQLIVLRAE